MRRLTGVSSLWMLVLLAVFSGEMVNSQTTKVSEYLKMVNAKLGVLYNQQVEDSWQMEVNGPSDGMLTKGEQTTKDIMDYVRVLNNELSTIDKESITDANLKRQLEKLPKLGYDVLAEDDMQQLSETTAEMSNIYKNIKLCSYKDNNQCNLTLIPHVQDILHSTNDINEIEFYWLEWRLKTGLGVKGAFGKFIELYQKTASLNGYPKASNFWFRNFGEDSMEVFNELGFIMQEMRPLFNMFHANVRYILRKRYGSELIKDNFPYPQHLAEIFIGRAFRKSNEPKIELPFPSKPLSNLTAAMNNVGYKSPEDLYQIAVGFYKSIGMPPLDGKFWSDNARPKANSDETYMTCWNKAWHYYGKLPTKFSYCPNVDEERFFNMFDALSDVYYSNAYKDQPTLFQEEPIPNFSESIGKIFSRAASSPRYLKKIVTHLNHCDHSLFLFYFIHMNIRIPLEEELFHILDKFSVQELHFDFDEIPPFTKSSLQPKNNNKYFLGKWRIPWVAVVISCAQILMFIFFTDEIFEILLFDPTRKNEIWRFVSYITLHADVIHLFLNVVLQILTSFTLETEQGHWKVFLVWLSGGIAASFGTLIFQPQLSMIGGSGCVYSILVSHIPHLIMNFHEISFKYVRILSIFILCLSDVGFSTFHYISNQNKEPVICIAAHCFGAINGLLVGLITYSSIKGFSLNLVLFKLGSLIVYLLGLCYVLKILIIDE